VITGEGVPRRQWNLRYHVGRTVFGQAAYHPAIEGPHVSRSDHAHAEHRGAGTIHPVSMSEFWCVKKGSPGLFGGEEFARLLGAGYTIEEFDPTVPLARQVGGAHVLLVRSVPVSREVIDAAPLLRLIQRPGAHLESVDTAYAASKGIVVCTVPAHVSGSGAAIAELIMFLLLALAKRYPDLQVALREGRMGKVDTYGLRGKVLGLIGVGEIGEAVIPMARGFGMRVWAVKRSVSAGMKEALGLEWLERMDRMDEMLAHSDFVSIHVPLVAETNGLVNARAFARMKPGALLVNAARAHVVDKDALIDALRSGHLGGVGLDVFWHEPVDPRDPIFECPNVVATPHGGGTKELREHMARVVVENIQRVRAGAVPLHVVDA